MKRKGIQVSDKDLESGASLFEYLIEVLQAEILLLL